MNTLSYLKHVIYDEARAIRDEIKESKGLAIIFTLVIVGLIIYLKPFPDRHIYFATAYPNSDWNQLAEGSARILDKSGLYVNMLYTDGAVDNIVRLSDPANQVNAAYTYGLALNPDEIDEIHSLGSVSYDPVWIFYNKSLTGEIKSLHELAKYRVGLGPIRSGSYQIAKKIFGVVEIPVDGNAHFLPNAIQKNGAKLKAGEIDAFIVVSTDFDPVTKELLAASNIAIFDFKNAAAYAKKFNSFVALTLPADSIDINKHVPKENISLLATTTSLVVKKSMHPDLQLALLMAAKDANRNASNLFFAKRGEFPRYLDPSIPISPVAEHFYDYGPPHAMRYLPYWIAGLVDRAWLLLLTIFAIFYPIAKLNIHFRKYRYSLKEIPHYRELLQIEKRLCGSTISAQEKKDILERLEHINAEAIQSGVPINEELAYFEFLNAIHLLKAKAMTD